MNPKINHSWNLTELQARHLQQELAAKVTREDQFEEIQRVAGVDVAYDKHSDQLVAAVVVLDANTLEIVETVTADDHAQFPYIPGLFSFRELPPLIKAFAKLNHSPDLIVCDGQGYAHPRRFGLACHLGVVFDIPTIGCGKTKLLGEYQAPDTKRGATAPLIDNGEVIGNALRTQTGINPIYVSIGHRISLETACKWILNLSPKYRLPETTRQADHLVRIASKSHFIDAR
ncbi:deoxyribonuclease V [Microbulbifer thermotolerans]|uniref:Endonuclease V n=1 Tax=Microbulbifer thermotolerans TaxID=252514 RepID=A0AB35I2D6_MICTH|nr:deoxyribonuclease V [Microbulbifer thermotolerans]MCX2783446.1 deoxyribonuclease V [Microbulbifer thermotolerans]MCX2803306.1 deoxyribonuclease V [Microbulbifer thermotolerans]MCX2836327.1 deoxyribonuclease V [Microbulbifer thermotolerans]MCX2842547.1 deoxyribonuclease V [Microbulbifer thermotolerans]WKT59710.1 deoxyribonuclease V [Microbulbifer thermotolerans]